MVGAIEKTKKCQKGFTLTKKLNKRLVDYLDKENLSLDFLCKSLWLQYVNTKTSKGRQELIEEVLKNLKKYKRGDIYKIVRFEEEDYYNIDAHLAKIKLENKDLFKKSNINKLSFNMAIEGLLLWFFNSPEEESNEKETSQKEWITLWQRKYI